MSVNNSRPLAITTSHRHRHRQKQFNRRSHTGSEPNVVLTLLLGGLAAAPVAPRLVGTLKPQLLGVVVGGFICVTNARGLLAAAAVPAGGVGIFFAVLVIAWLSAVVQVARSGVGPEKECA